MSSFLEGQMHQLANALEGAGFTPGDITTLGQSANTLEDVHRLVRGVGEVRRVRHIINCDAAPFVPDDVSVAEHRRTGELEWKPEKVGLYLSERQKKSGYIKGNELMEELENEPVLNANVLDYLLKNPRIIPEDWKKDEDGRSRFIFFWGTIYHNVEGNLNVRHLHWHKGKWAWGWYWVHRDWYSHSPAARLM